MRGAKADGIEEDAMGREDEEAGGPNFDLAAGVTVKEELKGCEACSTEVDEAEVTGLADAFGVM